MQRIDENTVKFTDDESRVHDVFNLMLDEGIDVVTATRYAVSAMPKRKVQAAFVEYLSDDTLTRGKGGAVIDKPAA